MDSSIINYSRDYLVQNDNGDWYKALAVPGDGNCFFHSISYFVWEDHRTIRQKCIQYLKANENIFKDYMWDNNMHTWMSILKKCLEMGSIRPSHRNGMRVYGS